MPRDRCYAFLGERRSWGWPDRPGMPRRIRLGFAVCRSNSNAYVRDSHEKRGNEPADNRYRCSGRDLLRQNTGNTCRLCAYRQFSIMHGSFKPAAHILGSVAPTTHIFPILLNAVPKSGTFHEQVVYGLWILSVHVFHVPGAHGLHTALNMSTSLYGSMLLKFVTLWPFVHVDAAGHGICI